MYCASMLRAFICTKNWRVGWRNVSRFTPPERNISLSSHEKCVLGTKGGKEELSTHNRRMFHLLALFCVVASCVRRLQMAK